MADIATKEVIHGRSVQTLCLRDWTVFVGQEEGLEVYYFLAKLSNGSRKSIVLCTEQLDLSLQIGKPLLLSLTTLQGGNPVSN